MRTVPSIISDFGRGGAPFIYIFDLFPNSGDAWAQKRYSTNRVTVGGEDYDNALIPSITRIVQKADIVAGGGDAAFAEVDVKFINQSKLHEDFLTDSPTGRRARISLSAISPNRCLNSSFEKRTGNNFEDWNEAIGTGGGEILEADTLVPFDEDTCVKMRSGATTASLISSSAFKLYRGERLTASWHMRGDSAGGGEDLEVLLIVGGQYYNDATGSLSASPVYNVFAVTAAQTWERKNMTIDWSDTGFTAESVDCYIVIRSKTGTVYVDAVQCEGRALTDYHHNRYELTENDLLPLYTGSVRQWKWVVDQIEMQLEPWQRNRHKEIPDMEISEYSSSWVVPSDSKYFPITYGDFHYDGLRLFWDWVEDRGVAFARGVLVNLDPTIGDGVEVYFDRPDMQLADYSPGFYRYLYHWDKKSGRYYEQMFDDRASPLHAVREFIDDCFAASRFYQHGSAYWLLQRRAPFMMFLKGEAIVLQTASMNNPANAIDANLATFASNTGSGQEYLQYKVQQHELEHTIVLPEGIYVIGDYEVYSGSGTANIELVLKTFNRASNWAGSKIYIINGGAAGTSWRNTPMDRTSYPAANQLMTALPVSINNEKDYIRKLTDGMKFEITLNNVLLTGTPESRIYECGLRIDFAKDLAKTNFAGQLYGRAYQTDWNSRYTWFHAVREPSPIIESICRHELGAVDADIDMDAFDAVQSVRSSSGWYAAGQVIERTKSEDVIDKICREFGLLYLIDELGRHSLKALGWGSSLKTLSLGDFYDPMNNLKFSMTSREEVVTDLTLLYRRNRWIDETREGEVDERYTRTAYCNRSGYSSLISSYYQTKCQDAYDALGGVDQKLVVKADWINDDQTAATVVMWILAWLTSERIMVSGDTFFDNVDLEIGDIVSFDSSLADYLPSTVTSSSRFVVSETRIKRSSGRIGLELLEVIQP